MFPHTAARVGAARPRAGAPGDTVGR